MPSTTPTTTPVGGKPPVSPPPLTCGKPYGHPARQIKRYRAHRSGERGKARAVFRNRPHYCPAPRNDKPALFPPRTPTTTPVGGLCPPVSPPPRAPRPLTALQAQSGHGAQLPDMLHADNLSSLSTAIMMIIVISA